jgi:hypothetical protein
MQFKPPKGFCHVRIGLHAGRGATLVVDDLR